MIGTRNEDLLRCEKDDNKSDYDFDINLRRLELSMRKSVSKMISRNISDNEWRNLENRMLVTDRFMVE